VVMDERGSRREGRAATGVRVNLLGAGDRFDLATRTASFAGEKTPLSNQGGDGAPQKRCEKKMKMKARSLVL